MHRSTCFVKSLYLRKIVCRVHVCGGFEIYLYRTDAALIKISDADLLNLYDLSQHPSVKFYLLKFLIKILFATLCI